jgi:hypothetical protein
VVSTWVNNVPAGTEVRALNGNGSAVLAGVTLPVDVTEWTRVSVPYTADATGFSRLLVKPSGSGVTFHVWGAQLEEGSSPSSYIPTAGTQVTRAADDCYRLVGNEFNKDSFTFFVEFEEFGPFDEYGTYASLSMDSASGDKGFFAIQRRSVNHSLSLRLNNNDFVTIDTPASIGLKKAAASYQNGEVTFCLNGVVIGSISNVRNNGITALVVGNFEYNESPVSGLIMNKDIRLFPTALSDAELITLTGGT